MSKGQPSQLPSIMRESISTRTGAKERLRPRAKDSPLLDQMRSLGLL